MIFVTLGSQKFQFNRLLIEIDKLIDENKIQEEVFAQIGYCDYKPKNFKYKEFLDRDEFKDTMGRCNSVITHGGTGAIISAVKCAKSVLAIPRLSKYKEHIDDHQLQITSKFKELGYIDYIVDTKDLYEAISKLDLNNKKRYTSNTETIIESIEEYLEACIEIFGVNSN